MSLHSAGTSPARFDLKRSAGLNATTADLQCRLEQPLAPRRLVNRTKAQEDENIIAQLEYQGDE